MKKIEYIFFRFLHAFIGLMPFRCLYIFSDICSFAMHHIFRYRRKTVYENLRRSFPEKSNEELNRITHKFYKNLCDVSLESIKGHSMSTAKLLKRYKCLNPEVANHYFEKRQSVIFALSHYANWEWGTQVAGSIFMHKAISFYKPLSNKYLDKYFLDQRATRGMELFSIYQTKFIFRAEDHIPRAYFLVSDQSPSNKKRSYWLKFLNQDTACIHGIESYARLFNVPVIYADVQRVGRGKYTISLEVLCDKQENTQQGEITGLYMRKLEEIIIKKPEDWLWSHRRWKIKKPAENAIASKKA